MYNLFNQSYGVHIMAVVINSIGAGHTNTYANIYTNTHTDVHRETILRNLACADLWPARTWFKNVFSNLNLHSCDDKSADALLPLT